MPALFTSTSSRPKRCTMVSNISRTCALLATSATTGCAGGAPSAASSSTVVCAAASRRSFTTTVAPSSAKIVAIARPIPEPAPVTSATRPASLP